MSLWTVLWERRWYWLGPPLVTAALLVAFALRAATR
jgi:hypothetical protein